jgi:hypothetical protein
MKRLHLLLLSLAFPIIFFGQEISNTDNPSGKFEFGMRTTISTFGSTGNPGTGFGGQFRIRLGKRINTEWFADFLTEDVEGLATRNDHHIGWSVMFYPFNTENSLLIPYILAGHCFDYTKINAVNNGIIDFEPQSESRLSSATQAGIGTHINISDQFDISLSSQYMVHLGKDIHSEIHIEDGIKEIHIEKGGDNHASLEGHLLFTISINYKLVDLW